MRIISGDELQEYGVRKIYDNPSNSWRKKNTLNYLSVFQYSSDLTEVGIQTAVTAIGASIATLVIDYNYSIANNLTIPSNIKLKFVDGSFTVASTKTVTINGEILAPEQQIFLGDGSVVIAGRQTNDIKASWFGCIPDGVTDVSAQLVKAINTANGQMLRFVEGTYILNSITDTAITADIYLKGAGREQTIFKSTATAYKAGLLVPTNKSVDIRHIQFDNFNYAVYNLSREASVINSLIFKDNKIINGNRGVRCECEILYADVSDNKIYHLRNVGSVADTMGIWLGFGDYHYQAYIHKWKINNNEIRDLDCNLAANCDVNAIIVQGDQIEIRGNIIETLTTSGGSIATGCDAEGIYAKARYMIIDGNIGINASQREGFIVTKGSERTVIEAPNNTYSYAHVISNNIIFYDNTYSADGCNGIYTYQPDVVISNNYIEGATHAGIRTEGDNTSVIGNVLRRCNSVYDIVHNYGKNYLCNGNSISDNLRTTGTAYFGIFVSGNTASNISGVTISNNAIMVDGTLMTLGQTYGWAVYGVSSKTISDVVISGNRVTVANPNTNVYSGRINSVSGTVKNVSISNNISTHRILNTSTGENFYLNGNSFNDGRSYVYNNAGLDAATTLGKIKTTNTTRFSIGAEVLSKSATDNLWDLTAVTTGVGEYKKVLLCLNASGTASIVVGTAGTTQATAPLPGRNGITAILGFVEIPNSYAGGAIDPTWLTEITGVWE